jgi:formamidopyrimidine-DNA glycosylase
VGQKAHDGNLLIKGSLEAECIIRFMPELPEVETVRRGLQRRLPGQRIVEVKVLRADSVAIPSVKRFTSELPGKEIAAVRRRGKYLLIDLKPAGLIVVHLRMSGRLLIVPGEKSTAATGKSSKKKTVEPLSPYERIRFELDRDILVFDDMRVFGRAWYLAGNDASEMDISGIAELGPEPLEGLTSAHLLERLANKTQSIKTALLDQTIVAGIGNIYADEILHLSNINPLRSAGSLSRKEIELMTEQIKAVLQQAIVLGGSSIRDYTNADGVNGNYQSEAFVYGRKGQNCRHCKAIIERIKLGGRSTHFCPKCQPQEKAKSPARR